MTDDKDDAYYEAQAAEGEAALMAWLEAHGPDDWHRVATGWNWDAGIEPLVWIAAQPECDRATAQALIVVGGLDYYAAFPDRDALVAAGELTDTFDLVSGLIERWNTGSLTRSEIASYEPGTLPDEKERYATAVAKLSDARLPWQLDPDVFRPIEGRQVPPFEIEGWPPEIWEMMDEDDTE